MIQRSFDLAPFPSREIPEISLSGNLSLQGNILALRYAVSGEVDSVLLPPLSPLPARRDELWKATCFEFFLAISEQPGYWEFNMSPSGDWNVYRMDAYRRIGFREETAITQLPFAFRKESAALLLGVSVDLTPIIPPGEALELSVTAIVQSRAGSETYWALHHPAPYADFHLREGFTLLLAVQTHPLGQSAPDG